MLVTPLLKRPPLQWQPLETPEFSVLVPGKAKATEGTEQTEAGPVKTVTWAIQTVGPFFAVSTADYPAGKMSNATTSKVLEGARDGAMQNVQGVVEKDAPVFLELEGRKKRYEGREFFGSTKAGIRIGARLFLVDDRLYQLICVSPRRDFTEEEFRKFVDSFKVKSAVAAAVPGAPPAATGPRKKK